MGREGNVSLVDPLPAVASHVQSSSLPSPSCDSDLIAQLRDSLAASLNRISALEQLVIELTSKQDVIAIDVASTQAHEWTCLSTTSRSERMIGGTLKALCTMSQTSLKTRR